MRKICLSGMGRLMPADGSLPALMEIPATKKTSVGAAFAASTPDTASPVAAIPPAACIVCESDTPPDSARKHLPRVPLSSLDCPPPPPPPPQRRPTPPPVHSRLVFPPDHPVSTRAPVQTRIRLPTPPAPVPPPPPPHSLSPPPADEMAASNPAPLLAHGGLRRGRRAVCLAAEEAHLTNSVLVFIVAGTMFLSAAIAGRRDPPGDHDEDEDGEPSEEHPQTCAHGYAAADYLRL